MFTDLHAARKALVVAEYNSYSPESFPGSKRYMENMRAAKALDAFDAEHPEIIAAIKAAKAAKALAEKPARDAELQRRFDAGLC